MRSSLVILWLVFVVACGPGDDGVERARAELANVGGENPMVRMELARRLAGRGDHDEALEHYLWCFDHGADKDFAFGRVRFTVLLRDIAALGKTFPPARAALQERRDALAAVDLTARPRLVYELLRLDDALEQPERSLEVFDALTARGEETRRARKLMLPQLIDRLVEAKRYDDILDPVSVPLSWMKRRRADVALTATMGQVDREMQARALQQVVGEGGAFYEALLATDRVEEAAGLGELLSSWEVEGDTAGLLARHADRAGQSELAQSWRGR